MRKENVQLKERMKAEFNRLKKMHEEELKLQEQEAMESFAVVQQQMDTQSEEMKKFGDFIKVQSETVKQQQDKISQQNELIRKIDIELAKERSQRLNIVDNMNMTDQARVQLAQKCVNQEKEIKQFNRLYLQLAAEKTEMNRAKTIAENKLAKKKEKFEELQHQYTVVVKQYQQQNKINQSLGIKP